MDVGAWSALIAAGACEIVATTSIKLSDGMRKWRWLCAFVVAMSGSIYLMSVGVRVIPIGTVYAVWTGIGAVGTAVVGMVAFAEPRTKGRIACLALIIAGVIGLRLG